MSIKSPSRRGAVRAHSPAGYAILSYFKWSFIVTALGLALCGWLGWNASGTISGALTVFFICAVLAVLEISLSSITPSSTPTS